MVSATVLGIFFVPLFYLWVKALFSGRPSRPAPAATEGATA